MYKKVSSVFLLDPVDVRAVRRASEIPQSSLAAAIGRSQVFISDFERGRAKLNLTEARAIAQLLGLTAPRAKGGKR